MPTLVNSYQLSVDSLKKSVNRQPSTVNRKAKGFTLIELLTVITIISIMIAVGVTSWTNAKVKSRDTKRKADIKAIQQALELYFQATGHYPPYNDPPANGEWVCWGTFINSNSYPQVRNALVPTYIAKMPDDPQYPGERFFNYIYIKTAVGKYELYAALENTSDPEKGGPFNSACGYSLYSQYNFKVTNP